MAASVGASATAIASLTDPMHPQDRWAKLVHNFFSAVGRTVVVPEHQIDGFAVISGVSLAFVAAFCEDMARGAVSGGLDRIQAELMTAQALRGMAALLEMPLTRSLSEVRENVFASSYMATVGNGQLEARAVRHNIRETVSNMILAALRPN